MCCCARRATGRSSRCTVTRPASMRLPGATGSTTCAPCGATYWTRRTCSAWRARWAAGPARCSTSPPTATRPRRPSTRAGTSSRTPLPSSTASSTAPPTTWCTCRPAPSTTACSVRCRRAPRCRRGCPTPFRSWPPSSTSVSSRSGARRWRATSTSASSARTVPTRRRGRSPPSGSPPWPRGSASSWCAATARTSSISCTWTTPWTGSWRW